MATKASRPPDAGTTPAEAVLLCAGRGKRLGEVTRSLPKALVQIRGRSLLDYHLDNLRRAGVRHVVLVLGYLGEQVHEHVRRHPPQGLDLTLVEQPEPRGTGDALRWAEGKIGAHSFLVGYADVFFGPREWTDMVRARPPALLAARVPDASRFGRLDTEGTGDEVRLRGLIEKDGRETAGLVNAGAYHFPATTWRFLDDLRPSPRGELELTDTVMALVRSGQTMRVVLTDTWTDVGTPGDLARAEALASTLYP